MEIVFLYSRSVISLDLITGAGAQLRKCGDQAVFFLDFEEQRFQQKIPTNLHNAVGTARLSPRPQG